MSIWLERHPRRTVTPHLVEANIIASITRITRMSDREVNL